MRHIGTLLLLFAVTLPLGMVGITSADLPPGETVSQWVWYDRTAPGHHIMPEKAVACISGRATRQSADTGRTGGCVGAAASVRLHGFGTLTVCADGVFLQSRPLCGLFGYRASGVPARVSYGRQPMETMGKRRCGTIRPLRVAGKHEPFGMDSGCGGLLVGMGRQWKGEASTPYYI